MMDSSKKPPTTRHTDLQIDVFTRRYEGIMYTLPALVAGRYRPIELLAAGGFGVILTAEDQRIFDRKVLIKANRYAAHLFQYPQDLARDRAISEQRERLEHEMKMLRVAQHRLIPGTPMLIDLVRGPSPGLYGPHRTPDGQTFTLDLSLCQNEPYLVISYITGETLERACQREQFRRNLLGNIKAILLKLTGLLYTFHRYGPIGAHRLAFIYQDLKPENVIWTDSHDIALIDFGSFAARTEAQMVPRNLFISTPPYQPPEFVGSLSPEETITPTADIFSLGVTVLHLLRGKMPLDERTGLLDSSLDALSLPDAWCAWLQKALAPDPRDRFASMQDARTAAFQLPAPKNQGAADSAP